MLWRISLAISCVKLLLVYAYHSTDFEVHRNWMAITNSLPLAEWYVSDISQWTLDYPPVFAWMEKCFAYVATLIDPQMLILDNLNYASNSTVVFQRLSVIVTDFVLVYAVFEYAKYYQKISKQPSENKDTDFNPQLVLTFLLLANVGLLIVDHIHFQYNGVLFGIMILSVLRISQDCLFEGAFWFAVLLNMKHIYLYIAPAVGIYLLRNACFQSDKDGRIIWTSFSFQRIFYLASIVASVFTVSFGPFLLKGQLFQVLGRLFPFKRGLCHAYWAPNFWVLYNVLDKGLAIAGSRLNLLPSNMTSGAAAAMTGGLVREYEHSILPTVKPFHTFLLTALSMLPLVLRLWFSLKRRNCFVECLSMCAFSAFLFGWHVHEKAVLLITIPLTLVALDEKSWAKIFLLLSFVGHYSLFPLIYTSAESPFKCGVFLMYTIFSFYSLGKRHIRRKKKHDHFLPLMTVIEKIYLVGFALLHFYNQFLHHYVFRLNDTLPFLPLLITSLYCALGVFYIWTISLKTFLLNQ